MKYFSSVYIIFFYCFFILSIFSCTPYKQIPYFQDLRRDSTVNEKINNYFPLTMQPGDLIGIKVISLNSEADLAFNYNFLSRQGSNTNEVTGYLIDGDGNVKLPLIGFTKVSGYTTDEISTMLEEKLQRSV